MTSLIRYARITISELLEGWETRHRGALLRSLVRWWTAAGSVGRHRPSVAALRSLLLSGALGTWYPRRDERSARREAAIELAAALNTALEMVRVLRLGFAIDAWLAQHEAESARRARLDGRALLLWSERARVAILAAWRTWRTRAHASSRANRWLTLAEEAGRVGALAGTGPEHGQLLFAVEGAQRRAHATARRVHVAALAVERAAAVGLVWVEPARGLHVAGVAGMGRANRIHRGCSGGGSPPKERCSERETDQPKEDQRARKPNGSQTHRRDLSQTNKYR